NIASAPVDKWTSLNVRISRVNAGRFSEQLSDNRPGGLTTVRPHQQSFLPDRLSFGHPSDVETHVHQTGNTEGASSGLRDIYDSSTDERTAIGDPHHCPVPIFLVVDVDQRPEWQRPMGGGKIFGLSVFSTRRLFGHRCIN